MPGPFIRRNAAWLIVVAGLLVIAAGYPLVHRMHTRRLEVRFEGPCVEDPEPGRAGRRYAGIVYEEEQRTTKGVGVTAETSEAGPLEESEEDRRLRNEIEGIHPDFSPDVRTGATRLARMREPTDIRFPCVPRFLTVAYPCDGALFPPNLVSPFVTWSDPANDRWQVRLSVAGTELAWRFLVDERRWRVPDDVWRTVKENAVERDAVLEVRGIVRDDPECPVHRSKTVRFRVSADPADDFIVYRLVAPPFVSLKTPDLYTRDIRQREPRLLLDARDHYCVNCHTFSSQEGNTGKLSLQIRYSGPEPVSERRYLALFDFDADTSYRAAFPFENQMTTFMAYSPDGTKLALTAKQRFFGAAGPLVFETQSPPGDSDIAVYDLAAGTVTLVEGASAEGVLEAYPRWTPDAQSIVFSSAPAGKHPALTQLELMIVPRTGGRAVPLLDVDGRKPGLVTAADGTERQQSVFYARFSPDGKWMTWTQADYGSLIKASSDIHIMNWKTRRHRPLASNVDWAADSWHCWSSNSRWIVFASKRDDGIFARMYLTHIDDEGNASPAVRVPIEDDDLRMSFNLPEFTIHAPPVAEKRLYEAVGVHAPERAVRLHPGSPDAATSP